MQGAFYMSPIRIKKSCAAKWTLKNPHYVLAFSNKKESSSRSDLKKSKKKSKRSKKSYSLGGKYPSIKFTPREADCMWHLMMGKTIIKVGLVLKLSPRTVEYYVSKMRYKLNCRTKSDLIEKVVDSDFLKNFSGRR
jgi:DNA-binding CsgD family transcriptional regulator